MRVFIGSAQQPRHGQRTADERKDGPMRRRYHTDNNQTKRIQQHRQIFEASNANGKDPIGFTTNPRKFGCAKILDPQIDIPRK